MDIKINSLKGNDRDVVLHRCDEIPLKRCLRCGCEPKFYNINSVFGNSTECNIKYRLKCCCKDIIENYYPCAELKITIDKHANVTIDNSELLMAEFKWNVFIENRNKECKNSIGKSNSNSRYKYMDAEDEDYYDFDKTCLSDSF